MGVYIKGMDVESAIRICAYAGWMDIDESDFIEVPEPHGRLVDENDVIEAIHERLKELQTHPEFKQKHGDIDLIGVMPYITKIKTAIEAEVEQ